MNHTKECIEADEAYKVWYKADKVWDKAWDKAVKAAKAKETCPGCQNRKVALRPDGEKK